MTMRFVSVTNNQAILTEITIRHGITALVGTPSYTQFMIGLQSCFLIDLAYPIGIRIVIGIVSRVVFLESQRIVRSRIACCLHCLIG